MRTHGRVAGIAWLPAALALHVAEEAPSLAAWAQRNTWVGHTQRDFGRVNAAALALSTVATWLVARTRRRAPFLAWHMAILLQQALWNPVFHASTTVAYREYAPGVVSALALFPATWLALTGAGWARGGCRARPPRCPPWHRRHCMRPRSRSRCTAWGDLDAERR